MIEVVGIGDDGWPSVTAAGREAIARAGTLVGGSRHLRFIPSDVAPGASRRSWPSPLRPQLRSFVEECGDNVVVLASGDPLRSGIATTLIAEFGPQAVRVHPTLSSETLARARMGWSAESVDVVTLVGRSRSRLRPFVAPGARLVVLCSDGSDPAALADLLQACGAGRATMTAWWHLGGEAEDSRTARARDWAGEVTADLVVLCVEVPHDIAFPLDASPAPGRPETTFEHDGLITKRDVRASALARLRPSRGALLWDLGAGSGAVGVEWALAAAQTRVVAVEFDEVRAARIESNAAALGVEHCIDVRRASTEEAVRDGSLPDPDAVFVGGGLSRAVIREAYARLRPGGRLVAHAVTLESEHLLVETAREFGGELVRLATEHVETLGRFHAWKPARAIVSWSVAKPAASTAPASNSQASTHALTEEDS